MKRTPNTLRVSVHLNRPALVVVNQNFFPGWRTTTGRVVSYNDLLAVRLQPGDHDVGLSYAPRSVLVGAMISALTTAVGALTVRRRSAH